MEEVGVVTSFMDVQRTREDIIKALFTSGSRQTKKSYSLHGRKCLGQHTYNSTEVS